MVQVGFGSRVRVFGTGEVPSAACGAVLEVKEGKKTEMMFHLDNEKILYILMGSVYVIIIQDGVVKKKLFQRGESISISRGLVHQFEAAENSLLVEFGTNPNAYTDAVEGTERDFMVVEKGSPIEEEPTEPGYNVIMTDADKQNVEETKEKTKKTSGKTPKKRGKRSR
jgi:mannose-6-phosphate isomerase-like protein (cupin superfamily)